MNTDHVTMQDITGDVALMQCGHCGEQHCPSLPMPATLLADRLLGFVRMHRGCQKPVEPSKQVELFDALAAAEHAQHESMTGVTAMHMIGLGAKHSPVAERELLKMTGGIDTSTDEPAPEIDPLARHGGGPLLDAIGLRHLITCVRPREFWPSVKEVEFWNEQVRADVQRWCRVEHAHKSPIAGRKLPERFPMPYVLSNIGLPPPKPRKGARPLANPTAKKRSKS